MCNRRPINIGRLDNPRTPLYDTLSHPERSKLVRVDILHNAQIHSSETFLQHDKSRFVNAESPHNARTPWFVRPLQNDNVKSVREWRLLRASKPALVHPVSSIIFLPPRARFNEVRLESLAANAQIPSFAYGPENPRFNVCNVVMQLMDMSAASVMPVHFDRFKDVKLDNRLNPSSPVTETSRHWDKSKHVSAVRYKPISCIVALAMLSERRRL
mmetsp:Transcript_32821/g.63024  ORF Transcript_32821/g.63024 Transcript_32821/m.63024 type:complete len:214 (-) Transcript_32821:1087-1728(-)